MSELAGTKLRLEEVRREGADRIYGCPIRKQPPAPTAYLLKATDSTGRTYFRREMSWPTYTEAVQYWMTLGTPNITNAAEDVA